MNGNAQKLIKYMEGASKRFVIPVYQRNYDWKMEHCKQLYDDLVKVIRQNRKSHFFGSIVSVQSESGIMEEFLIIDGQQRLTTVSLLLLAIYHLLQKGKVVSQDRQLPEKILKKYLIDEYEPEEKRVKLKPIKNDQKAFDILFEKDGDHIPDSNLTINYQYFYEWIQRDELTVDELFDAVCRLEIINISLNHEDNPQLIFESLNSTGLDLSEGDKIRNYILMGLETERQNKFYEKYWNRIENLTGYDVSSFIRDYLSVKQQSTPTVNGIYTAFKRYVEGIPQSDVELLLKELLDYAKRYSILLKGSSADERLNGCIYRLNRLSTTVTRPFFLEALRLREGNIITADGLYEIFKTTENYIFRRLICDLPTNALNKIFLLLHREIIRMDDSEDHYVPQDVEQAEYWLSQAAAQGNEYAGLLLERTEEPPNGRSGAGGDPSAPQHEPDLSGQLPAQTQPGGDADRPQAAAEDSGEEDRHGPQARRPPGRGDGHGLVTLKFS